MITGSWGTRPRYKFPTSRTPWGNGHAVCYLVAGHGKKFVVLAPDRVGAHPKLVHAARVKVLIDGHWVRADKTISAGGRE